MKLRYFIFLLFMSSLILRCGGSSSSSSAVAPLITPVPSTSPVESADLESLIVNTFQSKGINISVDPKTLDFNADGVLEKNDEHVLEFTLTNDTNELQSFSFQFHGIASGFSLQDASQVNLGSWSQIEIPAGSNKTFFLQFNAFTFGTQTATLTISGKNGYIELPFRATVSGDGKLKIVSPGTLCSDDDASWISSLDFLRVATDTQKNLSFKVCNNGGTDITFFSAEVLPARGTLVSRAAEQNAFEEFIWETNDEIEETFSLGLAPDITKNFSAPQMVTAPMSYANPENDYTVIYHDSESTITNNVLQAGRNTRIDVKLKPSFSVEATPGTLFEPVPANARLRLNTSLGTIDIPLLAVTGGREPVLKMEYQIPGSETWSEIDVNSDTAAVDFGSVKIFTDWVSDNSRDINIRVSNVGTGNQPLEFYAEPPRGFFEFSGIRPSFPMLLEPGADGEVITLRYAPTPTENLDDKSFDFGQWYISHNSGNGPRSKLTLMGEEEPGTAVELKFGGSILKKEYSPNEFKNICVIQIEGQNKPATAQNFTIANNHPSLPLEVSWHLDSDSFTATPDSGILTVEPRGAGAITTDLLASATTPEGSNLTGRLIVTTNYPATAESRFAGVLANREIRSFNVPLSAFASSNGECVLGGGKIIGKDSDTVIDATMIIDRITMILTSLSESTRTSPAFKFHFPIKIDHQKKRVWIAHDIATDFSANDPEDMVKRFDIFAHQITSTAKCAPLTTTPYSNQIDKGGFLSAGFDCNGNGTISVPFKQGTRTINTDSVCLPASGPEEFVRDGDTWVVYYHDFVKFDTESCEPILYGRIATYSYNKTKNEVLSTRYKMAEQSPSALEPELEQIYGAYQFDSYISFNTDQFSCGGQIYNRGDRLENDPDAIKACYLDLANQSDNKRAFGFINECSYFSFIIKGGEIPADADSENPDTESWSGYGTYEPHVDATGKVYDTKYDFTLYNVKAEVFSLSPGDRVDFFLHPGHLLYSELNVTFTTKAISDPARPEEWQDLIAVKARRNFSEDDLFIKNGGIKISDYWTGDGMNSEFSNVIDESSLAGGINFGGFGKGNYRLCSDFPGAQVPCDIVPAGWPINFDENNLLVFVGLGSFNGKGNTAPGFAKEDASHKGKSLYFSLHGCLVEGEPSVNAGCFPSKLDDAVMPETGKPVVEEYKKAGILPSGYPGDSSDSSAAECAHPEDFDYNDPLSPNYDPYRSLACINYKIFPIDRDRYTNYYNDNHFVFEKDYYNSKCGYGM